MRKQNTRTLIGDGHLSLQPTHVRVNTRLHHSTRFDVIDVKHRRFENVRAGEPVPTKYVVSFYKYSSCASCSDLAECCASSSRSPDHVVAAAVMYGSSRAVHARVARQHALNERTTLDEHVTSTLIQTIQTFVCSFESAEANRPHFLQYLSVSSMSRHRQLIGPQSLETHSLVIKLKVNRNNLT